MHRASSAFTSNRPKPSPNATTETTQTEIQPLFCRAAGSVTSGTTDDTGIESCSLGASPTLPPSTMFPTDSCYPIGGIKNSTGAAFKPVMGLREQPPPIPPKAVKEIPPLPPKSAPHTSPKDLPSNTGRFPNHPRHPLSTTTRLENSMQNVRSSGANHACDQLGVLRQNFYHSGTILSEPLPSKSNKLITKTLLSTPMYQSRFICHPTTPRHIRQHHFQSEDHSDIGVVQGIYKEALGDRKKLNDMERPLEGVGNVSCSVISTPLRTCPMDPNLPKAGVTNAYSSNQFHRSNLQSQSCSCTCQFNRHWETKALSPLTPTEISQSLRVNRVVKRPEIRNQRDVLCETSPVQFPQIRCPNSQTKSGCGGFQWLSHTLTRIFKPSNMRESNKDVSTSTTIHASHCRTEVRGAFGTADCTIKNLQRASCSNVLCGGSLWHRRSKSCTIPKFPRTHSKSWSKEIPKALLPNPHFHLHRSSPLPSHSMSVLGSTGTRRHLSATPMSLDRKLANNSQLSPCSDRSARRSECFHPITTQENQSALRTVRTNSAQLDHPCSGRCVDVQPTFCSCQQTSVSNQLEQKGTSAQRTVQSDTLNHHSPCDHRSPEAGSLDRTLSVNNQTHRPRRSFTKRHLRKSFTKKKSSGLSSPSLPGSYSEPEMPDDHTPTERSLLSPLPISSTASSCKNGGVDVLPYRKAADLDRNDEVLVFDERPTVVTCQCCSDTTVCDVCPNSFLGSTDSNIENRPSPCTLIVHTNKTVQVTSTTTATENVASTGSVRNDPDDTESQLASTPLSDGKNPVHHVHHIHHVHHFHHHFHHHHHGRLELGDTATYTGTNTPVGLLSSCDHHTRRLSTSTTCAVPVIGGGQQISCCLPDLATSEPSLNIQVNRLSTANACHTYNAYDSCTNSATTTAAGLVASGSCCRSRSDASRTPRPGSCCSCPHHHQQPPQQMQQPLQQPPQQTQRIRSPPPTTLAPLGPHLQPIIESASGAISNSRMQSPTNTVTVAHSSPSVNANSHTSGGCLTISSATGDSVASSDRSDLLSSRLLVPGPNSDTPGRTSRSRTSVGSGRNGSAICPSLASTNNAVGAVGMDLPENRSLFQRSMLELRKMGWYWGPLSFQEAQILLAKRPDGTFLVRDSGHATYILSLSFRVRGETYHTRIEHSQGRFSFWSQPQSHSANTMVEFIEKAVAHSISGQFHYFLQSNAQGQPPVEVPLLYPLSRFQMVSSLRHLARFTILSCLRRDHIDVLPLPTALLSYLKEKQFYVESLEAFEEAIRDRPPLEFRPRPICTSFDTDPSASGTSSPRNVGNHESGNSAVNSGSSQVTIAHSIS